MADLSRVYAANKALGGNQSSGGGGAVTKSGNIVAAGGKVVGQATPSDVTAATSSVNNQANPIGTVDPVMQASSDVSQATPPKSATIAPPVSPTQGLVPYNQAQTNLAQGGLKGNDLINAQDNLKRVYNQGFNTANASGAQAPATAGQGSALVGESIANVGQQYQPMPAIQDEMAQAVSTYTQAIADYLNPDNQRKSLVDEYKSMSKSLGIDKLNADLLDINRIMDGTEDDIRSEVTAASGFATESQVQAMTIGRNKSLLKKAQYISDQLTAAKDQLGVMSQLSAQDRQFTENRMTAGINMLGSVITIKQTMQKAAQDNYNNIIQRQGYDGLLAMTGGNAYNISLAEKTMGLQPGGLKQLAQLDNAKRVQEQAKEDLQLQVLQSNLLTDKVQRNKLMGYYDKPSAPDVKSINGVDMVWNGKEFVPAPTSGATKSPMQLSQAKSNIDSISNVLNNKGLNSAVGTSFLSKGPSGFWGTVGRLVSGVGIPAAIGGTYRNLTGEKQDFISGVKQITNQLTLSNLQNAKQNGATFGALSEGELNLLSTSASKLDSWAQKDKNGNVLGYNTSEKAFKAEMDKINNFAKLDYVLKGGSPTDVGIQLMADGHYYTKNSDGTITMLE